MQIFIYYSIKIIEIQAQRLKQKSLLEAQEIRKQSDHYEKLLLLRIWKQRSQKNAINWSDLLLRPNNKDLIIGIQIFTTGSEERQREREDLLSSRPRTAPFRVVSVFGQRTTEITQTSCLHSLYLNLFKISFQAWKRNLIANRLQKAQNRL